MVSSNEKGDRRERALVNLMDEDGWAVMRAPASGSATSRELPDVLVGRDGEFYAFEVKASALKPIYIDEKEVVDLEYFAENFGAKARIVAVFDQAHGHPDRGTDRSGMYALEIDDLHETDGGNYRIKREKSIDVGTLVENM